MSENQETRISSRFAELKLKNKCGLITFLTAGDPDFETSLDILRGLPNAGADFIEIGMPFSDPMADGPAIQASSLRALKNGMTLAKTIDLVKKFRDNDSDTPIILMGYFNPIFRYGIKKFLTQVKNAAVDGLIIVDLPPEESKELCIPAIKEGLNFIFLTTPTSTANRLPQILENASGFIYHVSITGITGTTEVSVDSVRNQINQMRIQTDLPIAVGFGIRTAEQVTKISRIADAAVVGSALIDIIKNNIDENGCPRPNLSLSVLELVRKLSQGVRATGP